MKVEKNSLFKNKQYLYLISSQIVSSLGDWLDLLALLALVSINLKASPMEMTYLMLCFTVPMILFSPIAGVLADKYDRKKLMIISDVVRAFVVSGIVFSNSLWMVYILLFIKSSFSALFMPSKNGKLKEIVSNEQIQQAISISSMIDNGGKILGPMIGGLLVVSFGVKPAFYIDAVTFILSALLLVKVKRAQFDKLESTKKKDNSKVSFFNDMKEGLSFIKTVPLLLSGLLIFSTVILVIQIADTQIMILLREIPGRHVQLVGYSMSASGLGMFIMAAILSKKEIHSFFKYLSFGTIGIGVGFATPVFFIHSPIIVLNILMPFLFFLIGLSAAAVGVSFNVYAQKNTPVHFSGRTFSTINGMTNGSAVIGMMIGGILVESMGVIATYELSGSLLVLIGIISLFLKPALKGSVKVAKGQRGIQEEA